MARELSCMRDAGLWESDGQAHCGLLTGMRLAVNWSASQPVEPGLLLLLC